ncbi:MAG: GreA/GreB family elongation factor [Alkalispirochaeta sp.]
MTATRILLTRADYDTLQKIVSSSKRFHKAPIPQFLRFVRELDSAVVLDPEDFPGDVITMRSRVGYTVGQAEEIRYAKLVFPAQTVENKENISILSPLGLALIGEREGAEVEYVAPGGTFRLRVRSVEHHNAQSVVQRSRGTATLTHKAGY